MGELHAPAALFSGEGPLVTAGYEAWSAQMIHLDDREKSMITDRVKGLFSPHSIQIGFGSHKTSYPMSTRCSFSRDKETSPLS
jgi:hypothetical protein